MSTIPAGLRADLMRHRMEDKATITAIGGLYVGSTSPVNFYDENGNVISAYETELLAPGTDKYPLVSNGTGQKPSYQQLTSAGIANGAITGDKLGEGTVVNSEGDSAKKTLEIYQSTSDVNILVIKYY